MTRKHRILAWGDSATAGTGYGTVTKHVLTALYNTGKYDIDHLAINFRGEFVDKKKIPWQMQPARLLDPRDPHGIKMFKQAVIKTEYDIVWIVNDIYVTHQAAPFLGEIRQHYKSKGKKPPVFIYYYPIDCHCSPWAAGMLEAADLCVCYTDHGKEETLKTIPHIANKLKQIPHGVDNIDFHPVSKEEQNSLKEKLFGIRPETKLIINVNRNSTRKQVPYSILAFKEFQKTYPNSIYYLHMQTIDQGGNLAKAIQDAGFNGKSDVLLPPNFKLENPMPIKMLSEVYCAADMFLSTHLGEGWSLTTTESLASGTPVVSPDNSCMSQQLGKKSERGYLYPCDDLVWIDDSGYRPKGSIKDIAQKMCEVIKDGPKHSNHKVTNALDFAKQHDWKNIGTMWVKLFEQAIEIKQKTNISLVEEV